MPKGNNKEIMTPTVNQKANLTFQSSSADKKMKSMMEAYSSKDQARGSYQSRGGSVERQTAVN